MRRIAAVCLALMLLTGCSTRIRDVFQPELPTLWGKTVTYSKVQIPEEAFVDPESICRTMAGFRSRESAGFMLRLSGRGMTILSTILTQQTEHMLIQCVSMNRQRLAVEI